jgi:hypothetical protein
MRAGFNVEIMCWGRPGARRRTAPESLVQMRHVSAVCKQLYNCYNTTYGGLVIISARERQIIGPLGRYGEMVRRARTKFMVVAVRTRCYVMFGQSGTWLIDPPPTFLNPRSRSAVVLLLPRGSAQVRILLHNRRSLKPCPKYSLSKARCFTQLKLS